MEIVKRTFLVFIAVWVNAAALEAGIKLVALPAREALVLRFDNPQFTLVEEERILTLQKGWNKVDFSWEGVAIDPDSIRLRLLSHPGEVTLASVSFPPGEAALVWEIFAPHAYEERTRISYLLSGIDRLVTYRAMTETDESRLDLRSYIVVRNFSGEAFDEAQVQLDYGEAFEKSIAHGETKQMLFLSKDAVPIEKTLTWDDQTMPWDPEDVEGNVGIPVTYSIANAADSGLGEHALWGGKTRIFQDDGHGTSIFLGEDQAGFTPVGEKMELRIGDSRDIVVTQRKLRDERVNLRRNRAGAVVLYDTDELIEVKVENFKDKPALLILIEHIPGQWEMKECSHDYEKEDAATLEFRLSLAAKENLTLTMHYSRLNLGSGVN